MQAKCVAACLVLMMGCAANQNLDGPMLGPTTTTSPPNADGAVAPPTVPMPSCTPVSSSETCGNGVDDDCNPATSDVCTPHNCAQVRELGLGTTDGVYTIQPPGVAEAFSVYCDMTTHGGGWALVMNSPNTGYTELPVADAIDPTVLGQLSVEKIARLLTVPSTEENNVRVETRDPDFVVSMRAVLELPLPEANDTGVVGDPDAPTPPPQTEPFEYSKYVFIVPWTANDNCDAFDPGPDVATVSESEDWMFANGSDGGALGLSESASRNGDRGNFFTNYDTGVDKACNRNRTDGAWRPGLAGSLWIR